jgi:hypothetical protein
MGLGEAQETTQLGKRQFDPVKAESEGLFGKLIRNREQNKTKKKSFGKKNFKKVKSGH